MTSVSKNLPQRRLRRKGLIRGDTGGEVFDDLKSHSIALSQLSPTQIQSDSIQIFGTTNKILQQQSKSNLVNYGEKF